MARLARGETINPDEVQVVHAVQRCVRRAYLCGDDPVSGQSFEHRRGWIRRRLEFLASIFGIDCLTYTVMSNHLHVVLRSRPDVVKTWSDEQVARRWLRLFPMRKNKDGSPAKPSESEIGMIVNNRKNVAKLRRRLSDISWWMRCIAENIAKAANKEDGCTGRFWEGRFKCQVILDEASLLACAAYVDLNPIRAALAETPEQSNYTGAKDRIDDLAQRAESSAARSYDWERSRRRANSGWLSPIEIGGQFDATGSGDSETSGRRASRKGFLPISLLQYLELLDWTGRQLRAGKRGSIPHQLAPILSRIGLDETGWCQLVKRYGRIFKRVAGTSEHLADEAARRGTRWMCAPGNPLGNPTAV